MPSTHHRSNPNAQHDYSWNNSPVSTQNASAEEILHAFAAMPMDKALAFLWTDENGLTEQEAAVRKEFKGPNIISSKQAPSWPRCLLEAILNPFNFLLVFLAIFQACVPNGEVAGAAVLFAMVLISVIIRFWQEYRSNLAVFRLNKSIKNAVKLRRAVPRDEFTVRAQTEIFEKVTVDKDLVPGDVILLSPGSVVPADGLILEASFLRISQSSWTGENDPATKIAIPEGNDGDSLFDLQNIALSGTSVVSGNGLALVLRTGQDVLIAKMASKLKTKREKNAFQQGISNMSWLMIGAMLIMVPIVLAMSGVKTHDWKHAALFSLSFAIGLVPEMLPAIVNGNLARGAYSLSRMKVICKRLDSVQRLGAMSILCCDKTGTLTKDEITLCEHLDCAGAKSLSVLELAIVDARSQGANGNNIDSAILEHRLESDEKTVNIAHYQTVLAIPFTFERRRSGCVVKNTGGATLIVKGAYDEILSLCSHARQGDEVVPLDADVKSALSKRVNDLNKNGYRVLLIAQKRLEKFSLDDKHGLDKIETEMTLDGMMTFIDPPKEDAEESISQLRDYGVEVKILTGDSLAVALNVCQKLGLVQPSDDGEKEMQAITGPELWHMYQAGEDIDQIVKSCKVFAKLTPDQKAIVIDSLRKSGHSVGMLGDGINDCIALRKSDVGISVNSGASAAKDCADVVLTEKGLDVIVSGVKKGRLTYGNTMKYVKMAVSCNVGNVISILVASAWLPFQPIVSVQMLTQDLLWDISQIGIPWDRVDPEYIQTPKDWNTFDLVRFVFCVGITNSIINISTFLLGWFHYGVQSTSNINHVKMFQAHYFVQGVLTQILLIHLVRTSKISFIQSRSTKPLAVITIITMVVGYTIPWNVDAQRVLGLIEPAASFPGFLIAQLLSYCILIEIVKWVYTRCFKTWL